MDQIPNLQEQVFVGAILSETNGKSSAALDSFSSWMLAGMTGFAAVLASQFDSISKHIDSIEIKGFFFMFFLVLIIGGIEKFLSMIVQAHAQGSALGRELGEKASEKNINLNFEIVFKEMEKAMIPPARWILAFSFAKVRKGDLVSSTRNYTKVMFLQGFTVFCQAAVTIAAVYGIAHGIRV